MAQRQFKRDYFNKCVANGGKLDDDAPEHPPLPPSHGATPQRDRTSELSQSLCPLIQSVAAQNELPVEFFARLIWQESRLRPDAVGPVTRSGKRAQGIAQFMPATAAERFLLDAFRSSPGAAEIGRVSARVAHQIRQSRARGRGLQRRSSARAGLAQWK